VNSNTLRKQFAKKLLRDQAYRYWVVKRLFVSQTPAEKVHRVTRALNGVGFSAPDAPVLSPLAEKLLGSGKLTRIEDDLLKWRLPQYWRQFTETRLMIPPERKPPSRANTRTSTKVKREAA